jgi:hypothetical protein
MSDRTVKALREKRGQLVSDLLPARAETAGGHRWVTRRLLVSRVAYRVADCSSISSVIAAASALDLRLVHDLDFEIVELRVNLIEKLRR